MKRCYEVRCCPASYYLSCKAYNNGTNCWNTKDVLCCKKDNKNECKDCKIYQAAKNEEKKSENNT